MFNRYLCALEENFHFKNVQYNFVTFFKSFEITILNSTRQDLFPLTKRTQLSSRHTCKKLKEYLFQIKGIIIYNICLFVKKSFLVFN